MEILGRLCVADELYATALLGAGDVILTGSPAGVGFFQGVFLKAGDVVEMTADRIGTLRNEIIDA
jgi:2-keto-4-pentenoate hydratase/2-oxohepta-3-ene-1,7-dioic acid hydratase in catechol pathway